MSAKVVGARVCVLASTHSRKGTWSAHPAIPGVVTSHTPPPPLHRLTTSHSPPPPSSCGSLFNTGFDIPLSGWLEYLGFIADLAKSLGLAVGLKNSQVLLQANPQIIDKFDWAVNEGEDRGMAYRGCRD